MGTDNSHFEEKLIIRKEAVEQINKSEINVLELFAGKSLLWNAVKQYSDKTIKLLSVEKERGKNRNALEGDNMKYIDILDLSNFDIVDIDAYGSCFPILDRLSKKKYNGIIICTDIRTMMGRCPSKLLNIYGITDKMISKCPTLVSKANDNALFAYINKMGVNKIRGYFIENEQKKYFYFSTTKKNDYI